MDKITELLVEIKTHLKLLETAQIQANRLIVICLVVIIGGGNPVSSELIHRLISEKKSDQITTSY